MKEFDRRMFLKSLGMAAGAALLSRSRLALAEPKKVAIKLDKVEKVRTVGGWVVVTVKDRKVLLVRDGEASIRAFNPLCTHQQCSVAYDDKAKKLVCPCHAAAFDLDGKVLGGPAPKPLQVYPASLSEDRVVITIDE